MQFVQKKRNVIKRIQNHLFSVGYVAAEHKWLTGSSATSPDGVRSV